MEGGCRGGVGQASCARGKINITHVVHSDIQEVCGISRTVTALVLKFTGVWYGAITLLTSSLKLNT